MNPSTLSIIRALKQAGHRAYVVGGAARDLLMGHDPEDIDIATDAEPDRIRELFPQAHGVGAHFGVMLVTIDDQTYEVATFRADGEYQDGRRPDSVTFTNAEEVIIHLTDPMSGASAFRTQFTWSPTAHSIAFSTLPGRRYRVERSVDPRDPAPWSEVITFVGTGADVTIPLGLPFSARWFYRVGVSLD